jgi:hypothetical protein
MTVTLLLTKDGQTVSVWPTREGALAKAIAFNADPFVEPGTPDPDAPYRVEEWTVERTAG